MSLKKIDANLARITTNGDKLNVLIHTTAMLILKHATKSGDCTRALSLVKAMPASMRRTTLIAWFTKYSPIRIVFQNDAVGMLKKDDKGYTAFALDKAEANPFYKIAENNAEPGLLDFDKFIKMIQAMAKREAAKADEGKVKPEDVASIKAACDVLASLKFERIEPANDDVDPAEILAAKALAAQLRAIKAVHVEAVNNDQVFDAPDLRAVVNG